MFFPDQASARRAAVAALAVVCCLCPGAGCSDDDDDPKDGGADTTAADLASDVAPDGQLPPTNRIGASHRPAEETSTDSEAWVEFDQPEVVVSSDDDTYLIVFNAPDTWNDTEGGSSWFSITVDGAIVAQGVYSAGAAGQKIPVTLVTVQQLASGSHTIKAQWKASAGSTAYQGAEGTTVLLAMKVPQAEIHHAVRPAQELTIPGSWNDTQIPPLTIESSGGDYLLLLSAPEAWNDATGWDGLIWYRIKVDDDTVASGGTFGAVPDQRLPFTLVTVEELPAGTHTLTAEFSCMSEGGSATLGAAGRATLVALQLPEHAEVSSRIGSEYELDSTEWEDLDTDAISLESGGENHLLILSAPDTWNKNAEAGPRFQLTADGEPVAQGAYTSAAADQRVSLTLIGAALLEPGSHTIQARWSNLVADTTSVLGRDNHTWLIALR